MKHSLWAAVSAGELLPAELLLDAQHAFTAGLNVTARVGGVVILALAALSIVSLRHVGTTGGEAERFFGGE
jgi:MFS transporter, DHA2 family, multidrug resistance protein